MAGHVQGRILLKCVWGGKDWQGSLIHPLELLPLHVGQGCPGMWRLHLLLSHPDLFKKRGMSKGEEDQSFCLNSWCCGSQGDNL